MFDKNYFEKQEISDFYNSTGSNCCCRLNYSVY